VRLTIFIIGSRTIVPTAYRLARYSSRTLVGRAVMPIGVLEVNPAIPHAALSTTSLSGSFAGYLLLRNSLAESLSRLLRKLFHGELPQIGSPGFMALMIPQAVDTFELFGTATAVVRLRLTGDVL
jgi:hypothetical protein